MGMKNFKGEKPVQADALVAKNYCSGEELSALNSVVSAYLELAEMQARRRGFHEGLRKYGDEAARRRKIGWAWLPTIFAIASVNKNVRYTRVADK